MVRISSNNSTDRRTLGAGFLLCVVLVFGMLHFPTTCTCGAAIPHTHSLIELARGHQHVGHVHTNMLLADSDESESTGRTRVSSFEVEFDGPRLVESTASPTRAQAFVRSLLQPSSPSSVAFQQRYAGHELLIGRVVTPEPNPPRHTT